jgi:ribosomal protein S18 acetylase RimI-like enzyme
MEKEPSEPIEIAKVNLAQFQNHQREVLDIEKELIENSSSAYLIDEEDELDFMLDALKKGGLAYLVQENGKTIGFLVAGPLDDGTNLPQTISQNFPIQNCLHIKVMYIKNGRRGIGTSLIQHLIDDLDKSQWQYLFVRTWVDPPNEGAINFYTNKAGFEIVPNSEVESTKTRMDNSGTFKIKRQYFQKKL